MNTTPPKNISSKPDNAIHWTKTLENKIPVIRGIHTPPLAKTKLKPLHAERYMGKIGEVAQQLNAAIELTNSTKVKDRDDAFKQSINELLPNEQQWQTVIHSVLVGYCDENTLDITNSYKKQTTPQLTWLMSAMLGLMDATTVARLWVKQLIDLPIGYSHYWKHGQCLSDRFYESAFKAISLLRHAIIYLDDSAYQSLIEQVSPYLENIDPYADKNRCIYGENNHIKQKIIANLFPELLSEESSMILQRHADYWAVVCVGQYKAADYWIEDFPEYWLLCIKQNRAKVFDDLRKKIETYEKAYFDINVKREAALLNVAAMLHSETTIDWVIAHLYLANFSKPCDSFLAAYPLYVFKKLLKREEGNVTASNFLRENPWIIDNYDGDIKDLDVIKYTPVAQIVDEKHFDQDLLPDILVKKPWAKKNSKSKSMSIPSVTVETLKKDTVLDGLFSYEEIDEPSEMEELNEQDKVRMIVSNTGVRRQDLDTVIETQTASSIQFSSIYEYENGFREIFLLPKAFALSLWNNAPVENVAHNMYYRNPAELIVNNALAVFGVAAIPRLLDLARHDSKTYFHLLEEIEDDDICLLALEFLNKKTVSGEALQYLSQWAETTLRNILPIAFSDSDKRKGRALEVLAYFCNNDHENVNIATIDAIASAYGEEMQQAWQSYKDMPKWMFINSKAPAIPNWVVTGVLPSLTFIQQADKLPASYTKDIITILMLGNAELPYAGVAELQKYFTADSLAEMVIKIFDQWLITTCRKDLWAFYAMQWLSTPDTIRKIAQTVRFWIHNGSPGLALQGMDLLALHAKDSGDDMALVNLNSIARQQGLKNKFKQYAKDHIREVAYHRGLSQDQLADRLVPDFGLDERGHMQLDYGPRQFTVKFDESLIPYIVDENNKRLKAIPRSNKNDDSEKAQQAKKAYKNLKTDIAKIANQQLKRLEHAMCQEKRWQSSEFLMFFVNHPLMVNVSQRLVWGVYEENQLSQCFRVAEDLSILDADDDDVVLDENSQIGIVHPLLLSEEALAAWGQTLTDYEIIPPFEQLARTTYHFSSDEIENNRIEQFTRQTVYAGSIIGLLSRGWDRDTEIETNHIFGFRKHLSDTYVELKIEPGFYLEEARDSEAQTIEEIKCPKDGGLRTLSEQFPIAVSEMLRDIALVRTVE